MAGFLTASALQEAGWLNVTPIGGPRFDLLGIYPTAETLVAQLIVAAIALLGFAMNWINARKR